MIHDDDIITVPEAADRLRIHPETLHRWIRAGRVQAIHCTSKTIRVRWSELLSSLDCSTTQTEIPSSGIGDGAAS